MERRLLLSNNALNSSSFAVLLIQMSHQTGDYFLCRGESDVPRDCKAADISLNPRVRRLNVVVSRWVEENKCTYEMTEANVLNAKQCLHLKHAKFCSILINLEKNRII